MKRIRANECKTPIECYRYCMQQAAMWRRFWKQGKAIAERLMMMDYRQAMYWKGVVCG